MHCPAGDWQRFKSKALLARLRKNFPRIPVNLCVRCGEGASRGPARETLHTSPTRVRICVPIGKQQKGQARVQPLLFPIRDKVASLRTSVVEAVSKKLARIKDPGQVKSLRNAD